jgi:acetylornithine deacetylase/succinyl-diaminopimelate desuccinylase-like protein
MSDIDDRTNDTVALLQALIRNECVNDGTEASGNERRNADLLQTYLEAAGLDVQRFTSIGDRTSIVARIEGSDPTAPKLCMMGHTDVVPVNPDGWSREPFSGDIIDDEVWGRGALDMLCLTSSMAVAIKHLASTGFRPRGDLIYFGVADEEAGGVLGAKWMIDNNWDAVACDYMVTEMGGFWAGDGKSIVMMTEEKGVAGRRLVVHGQPSHGSAPYKTDNALVKASEIVRRISTYQGTPRLDDLWTGLITTSGLPEELQRRLLDPARLADALDELPPLAARRYHACSHTTMSCNVVHGGQKTNIVPDRVELEIDIRTLPGISGDDVDSILDEILGDLATSVTVSPLSTNGVSTASPRTTPLWDGLTRQVNAVYPKAELMPALMTGATDGRYFREKGTVVYGAGLFSPKVDRLALGSRFHGNDERIDIESLALCTDLWSRLAQDVVGQDARYA